MLTVFAALAEFERELIRAHRRKTQAGKTARCPLRPMAGGIINFEQPLIRLFFIMGNMQLCMTTGMCTPKQLYNQDRRKGGDQSHRPPEGRAMGIVWYLVAAAAVWWIGSALTAVAILGGLPFVILAVFAGLKLGGIISWSWWWGRSYLCGVRSAALW